MTLRLDDNLNVKIADFGLSRDVYESGFYEKKDKNGKLPIKWMSPESIKNGIYNNKTDVVSHHTNLAKYKKYSPKVLQWSYGIVLWELITRGQVPYPFVRTMGLVSYLNQGKRLSKPENCPTIIYTIMTSCWFIDVRMSSIESN